MALERKPNETEYEYHKRIIYGKLVDKTLSDIDYTELSELVYGQAYSSDVARRMMYGSRKTIALLEREQAGRISDKNVLDELEIKRVELQKERQRFFDQRREYNKLVSVEGRKEHLCEKLVEAAENLNKSVGDLPFNEMKTATIDDNVPYKEAVLVFSDWHYGMTTQNVFNTYNTEICKKRVIKTVESAVERIILNKCRKLHVVVLGDLFHGAIHTSARVASEELVCDQIMQVSEILAQAVSKLSRYVENVEVYMTYGNHARTVANKNDSIHKDNMERIIPWWMAQRFKDNLSVKICDYSDNEFLLIDACGHKFCATHGDLDSVKSSPRLLTTLFWKQYGENIEYILLGDKHHTESFEELGVTSLLCGALCGTDDYANDKRLFSTPSQLLLIVDEKNGVDAEYRIKCSDSY